MIDLLDEFRDEFVSLAAERGRAARKQNVVGKDQVEAVGQHLHLDRSAHCPACDLVSQFPLFLFELGNVEVAEHELGAQLDSLGFEFGVRLTKLVSFVDGLVIAAAGYAAREQ